MAEQRTEADITQGLLGLELYVIETGPARSERTREILPAHIAHQIDLEKRGILFSAGPVFEEGSDVPSKGMIVIRAKSFEEARQIADSDPFHASGIRTYTIRKWIVNEGAMSVSVSFSDQRMTLR